MVAAVVLAAGAGRRYGGGKQLALVAGRPLLEHAVAAVRGLDEVVVVLGARADRVRAGVALGRVHVVVAHNWAEGQAASLRAGVAAVGDADAVVVTLGDQPGITRAAVGAVVGARDPERFDAVRATFDGVPGHPVLLERPLLARVPALRGDVGARALLAEGRVRELDLTGVADPRDVDTRSDLLRFAV